MTKILRLQVSRKQSWEIELEIGSDISEEKAKNLLDSSSLEHYEDGYSELEELLGDPCFESSFDIDSELLDEYSI